VLHLDLYRLRGPEELAALGLADYLPGSRLWLIEWPERGAGQGLPPADADVHLDLAAEGRSVRLLPRSALGEGWIAGLSADPG
jgi:tRNA threonylcarbamoyladenosine biosynthesis protein TsaE